MRWDGTAWSCAPVTVTEAHVGDVISVTASTGIAIGGTAANPTVATATTVPNWTSGTPTCANGDVITAISASGVATCQSVARAPNSGLGYAFISCTAGGCTISSSWSYNSAGQAVTVTRAAAGNYQVTFTGMTSTTGGHVQVTAYGGGATFCKVSGFTVPNSGVTCFNTITGAPVDNTFNILMIP
jgi:hypothetical protein